ncbi:hypothetical protein EON65_49055 [archaeon]|nr:MAG: hypothetical protein EON65_49055 [archaeon]
MYVFPWTAVAIAAILFIFKPDQLTYFLAEQADHWKVDIRTMIVFTILGIVGSIVVSIGAVSLYVYIRDNRKDANAQRDIYEEERQALIALFNSLDGKNWFDKARWCSDEPIGRWHGVKLNPHTGRVNKLILPENRLGGMIPEDIGKLEGLIEIDFRRNNIGGELVCFMSSIWIMCLTCANINVTIYR